MVIAAAEQRQPAKQCAMARRRRQRVESVSGAGRRAAQRRAEASWLPAESVRRAERPDAAADQQCQARGRGVLVLNITKNNRDSPALANNLLLANGLSCPPSMIGEPPPPPAQSAPGPDWIVCVKN
ncbi:unnamed protein product [Cylicocyclus nassatus]|uniref:Uncharacterized protein n=1 Tax=Cylicocyclus nassatus TaxID=53992 RepID=A0AA36DKZ6_CYLNA|nr:unnamed protein product [Cylicocyclus nassatus]